MLINPTKKGKEIEENWVNVNIDPLFYIYENYNQNNSRDGDSQMFVLSKLCSESKKLVKFTLNSDCY